MVGHALLDSPSAAGGFRFAIDPGEETVFDVDMRLYPRVELAHAGIAPLTSMFELDPSDRAGVDDYRQAVHDPAGLAMPNATGAQTPRQLQNPPARQHRGFQDPYRPPLGGGPPKRHDEPPPASATPSP